VSVKKTVFWDVAPCTLVEADWRLTGVYCPDGEGSEHLWNVGQFLPDYTVQHPRRQSSLTTVPDRTFETRQCENE
jgi:hypothetical protein